MGVSVYLLEAIAKKKLIYSSWVLMGARHSAYWKLRPPLKVLILNAIHVHCTIVVWSNFDAVFTVSFEGFRV